ncbi:MAG: hypothetical protein JSW52_07540 [Candidatus Coatesbacteria bacterium]|nr:MAG: hypothetical protein JSW52_07540 [Candidatus Coatesbacteria bacterium]
MVKHEKYVRKRRRDDGPGFPVWRTVVNILILAIPPAVGFWGLFDLWGGVIAVSYLGGILLYLLIVAPWVTCTHCGYFERWCPFGLGKLSAAMYSFGSGNVEAGNRVKVYFWSIWYSVLPTASYVYYLYSGFTFGKLVYFIVFVIALALFWVNSTVCCNFGSERRICPLLTLGGKEKPVK